MSKERILCIRCDRIGDMLISTPVFRRLRQVYPDAEIDVVCSPLGVVALEGNPHINHVYIYNKKHLLSLFPLFLQLRKPHDIVINFNADSKTTNALTVLAKGKKKSSLNLNDLAPWSGKEEEGHHYSGVFLRSVEKEFNLPHYEDPSIQIEFYVPNSVHEEIRAKYPPVSGKKRLCIFIGNIKKIGLRWPIDKFVALTKILLRFGEKLDIWIMAGPEDVPLLDAYKGITSPYLHYFIAHKSLRETAAFLKTCDAFVTCSSSPQHLAGAMQIPITSINYPWSEYFWTPRGPLNFSAISDKEGDVRDIPIEQVYTALNKTLQHLLPDWEEIQEK